MEFCSIASGSSGNCIFAGTDHASVLVDVGISGKRITDGLRSIDRDPAELGGILITHEHVDHIQGLGVMARKYHVPIYGTPGTLEYIMKSNKLGKIDPELFHMIHPDEAFSIGDMEIKPFRISHDAAQPCAYRIENGDKSIAVATDMGCYDEYTVENLTGLNGLLLEANHDINMLQVGPYPYPLKQRILGQKGHLSNETAGSLLCDILNDDLKTILLGHLSKENNYEALCFATVTNEITMGDNPYKADDFDITVAHRDRPSMLYAV